MSTLKVLQYDADAQEAVVEIEITLDESATSARSALRVFCYPMFSSEMKRKISLFGFLVTNIVSENAVQAPQKTNGGYFSYHLFAKVLDPRNRLVQLGDIDIVLDCPIPQDIAPGSFVSFDVMRLDLQC